MASKIEIIYGAYAVSQFEEDAWEPVFDVLTAHGVTALDTAAVYPGSEKALGDHKAGSRFKIHTKAPGGFPETGKKENVLAAAAKSLSDLQQESVEIYYLHAPDATTPITETLEAIQELYKAGKFKKFGLSNFSAEDVQKILDYTKERGYVQPSVYQGNYNPVARHLEKDVIPTCQKLNISFKAYSPMAGSFLALTPEQITGGSGRFGMTDMVGQLYTRAYNKPTLLEGLKEWGNIASDAGISQVALAYRWDVYHSALKAANGDGIIIGSSSLKRLDENLKFIEDGPLPEAIASRVDALWEKVKDEAPIDMTKV